MRVSETLELSIPDDGLDVGRLERYLAREIEEEKLAEARGGESADKV